MIQLILHLLGDYVTQSDWMANNKTKRSWPALCHAVVYSLPFLLLKPSWAAFSVILITHFLIDRFRMARFVVWAKNVVLQPRSERGRNTTAVGWVRDPKWEWSNCSATGYPSETPAWLSVWLLIAADNTLHLAINYAALKWL